MRSDRASTLLAECADAVVEGLGLPARRKRQIGAEEIGRLNEDQRRRVLQLLSLLERRERSFASLEEMLDPAPMRRVLLSTRCGLCPA